MNLFLIYIYSILPDTLIAGQGKGAVRLLDNGVDSSSLGRVQIYFDAIWGVVCSDGFGTNEADVICHQLGYVGASSFSKASNDT